MKDTHVFQHVLLLTLVSQCVCFGKMWFLWQYLMVLFVFLVFSLHKELIMGHMYLITLHCISRQLPSKINGLLWFKIWTQTSMVSVQYGETCIL